jgi:OOP family OmpA-OmpF porin
MLEHRSSIKRVAICASSLFASAVIFASPASAQWYEGLGMGSAQAKLGNASHETSGKFFVGYQFSPNWGVEGQYVSMGTHDATNGAGGGSYKPVSWGLAATGTLPMSTNAYFIGKLGAAFNRVSTSNVGGGNNTDLLFGVGFGYNFDGNWSIRAEYESFGNITKSTSIGGDIKGDNRAVIVKYSFK